MSTVGQWREQARLRLAHGGQDVEAYLEADLLAAHVTGLARTSLFAYPERLLTDTQLQALEDLLQRRLQGEPLAYLTGQREFWSVPLAVMPGTLVPRPETELLVELALTMQHTLPEGCIIELGTGSGAIAVALARSLAEHNDGHSNDYLSRHGNDSENGSQSADRTVIAVEKYPQALQTARRNMERFAAGQVQLVQASWLDAMASDTAALVIANPPYLAADDPHLSGLAHEPITALVSGDTGLEDIEQIIDSTRRVGRQGCLLLLEHGSEQGPSVRALLQHYNYKCIHTARDLAGLERVSHGYRIDHPHE